MSDSTQLKLADQIRNIVFEKVVRPALKSTKSELKIRAGDIHSAMHLHNRVPAVCSALESGKFQELCSLELVHREGANRGSSAVFFFRPGKRSATISRISESRDPSPKRPAKFSPRRASGSDGLDKAFESLLLETHRMPVTYWRRGWD
jgi:hypothetical protein